MSLLIDLDRLDAADRQSPLFGVNRAALYSFHEADHGERDGSSLRLYAQRRAAEHGIDLTGGRVLLLCYPRLLGLHLQPTVGLFLLPRRRRARSPHLRGSQHLWRYPPLRPACDARRGQRGRHPAGAGKAVLRLALCRDGDALSFPGLAARGSRQAAYPRDRPRRPRAGCHLQRPPPRADQRPRCCARSSRCRWSP